MKRFYYIFAVVHIPKFVLWEATGNVGTPMVAPVNVSRLFVLENFRWKSLELTGEFDSYEQIEWKKGLADSKLV